MINVQKTKQNVVLKMYPILTQFVIRSNILQVCLLTWLRVLLKYCCWSKLLADLQLELHLH